MLSVSPAAPSRRNGLALETFRPAMSPFFSTYIHSPVESPLLPSFVLSAHPNTLGLVEEDGTLIQGIPIPLSHQPVPRIGDYTYATGWVMKPSGEFEYFDPGVIEEVDDDDGSSGTEYNSGHIPDVIEASMLPKDVPPPPTPDLRSRTMELLPEEFPSHSKFLPAFMRTPLEAISSFTTSSISEPEEPASTTFSALQGDLQLASPPRPPHSSPSPFGQVKFSGWTLSSPRPSAASTSPSMMSEWQILVYHNLEMLRYSAAEMAAFQEVLQQQAHDFHIAEYVNICQRVQAALASATESLCCMPVNGSNSWLGGTRLDEEKYIDRLSSLQRTVTRLRSLVRYLNPPRLCDKLESSIYKLEEHENKLLNLAAKFKSAVKRLRVRHAHVQLAQAHSEYQQMCSARGGKSTSGGLDRRIQRRASVISRRSSVSGQGL